MRKKSHIEIVRYLIKEIPELKKHRLAMYIGCILPDCLPSFIYKRHMIESTIPIVGSEISKIERYNTIDTYFCRHLGILTHYISDYCTLPHNRMYTGNIKDHCKYEKQLKNKLKEYLSIKKCNPKDIDDSILKNIIEIHNRYVDSVQNTLDNIENDCEYIMYINMTIAFYLVNNVKLEELLVVA